MTGVVAFLVLDLCRVAAGRAAAGRRDFWDVTEVGDDAESGPWSTSSRLYTNKQICTVMYSYRALSWFNELDPLTESDLRGPFFVFLILRGWGKILGKRTLIPGVDA